MNKIKSLDDLRKMRDLMRETLNVRKKSAQPDQIVQVKVSMATCGIAAGAKDIMSCFIEKLNEEKIDALVSQTGCMGYCYAEPTVEIILPDNTPLVFGYVTKLKVDELVGKYIKEGILIDDIMPITYSVVDPE